MVWSSNMAANKALTTVHGSAQFPGSNSLRPMALSWSRKLQVLGHTVKLMPPS